jgi:hypothetical protein
VIGKETGDPVAFRGGGYRGANVLTMSLGVNCTTLGTEEVFRGGKLQES